MFEREIRFIYDFSLNQVRRLGSAFTIKQLKTSNIHPALLKYIEAEIDFLIYEDRKRVIEKSNFDYSGERSLKYFELIAKEIKAEKRLTLDYIGQLLLHATSFNINYLAQPKWALTKLIFPKEETLSVVEVKQILNYLYFYPHIKQITEKYFNKKQLVVVEKNEFENLVAKVQSEIFSVYSKNIFEKVLLSIAEFYNIGSSNKTKIPLTAVELFIKETNLTEFINRYEDAFGSELKLNIEISELQGILFSAVPVRKKHYLDRIVKKEEPETLFKETPVVEKTETEPDVIDVEKAEKEIPFEPEEKIEEEKLEVAEGEPLNEKEKIELTRTEDVAVKLIEEKKEQVEEALPENIPDEKDTPDLLDESEKEIILPDLESEISEKDVVTITEEEGAADVFASNVEEKNETPEQLLEEPVSEEDKTDVDEPVQELPSADLKLEEITSNQRLDADIDSVNQQDELICLEENEEETKSVEANELQIAAEEASAEKEITGKNIGSSKEKDESIEQSASKDEVVELLELIQEELPESKNTVDTILQENVEDEEIPFEEVNFFGPSAQQIDLFEPETLNIEKEQEIAEPETDDENIETENLFLLNKKPEKTDEQETENITPLENVTSEKDLLNESEIIPDEINDETETQLSNVDDAFVPEQDEKESESIIPVEDELPEEEIIEQNKNDVDEIDDEQETYRNKYAASSVLESIEKEIEDLDFNSEFSEDDFLIVSEEKALEDREKSSLDKEETVNENDREFNSEEKNLVDANSVEIKKETEDDIIPDDETELDYEKHIDDLFKTGKAADENNDEDESPLPPATDDDLLANDYDDDLIAEVNESLSEDEKEDNTKISLDSSEIDFDEPFEIITEEAEDDYKILSEFSEDENDEIKNKNADEFNLETPIAKEKLGHDFIPLKNNLEEKIPEADEKKEQIDIFNFFKGNDADKIIANIFDDDTGDFLQTCEMISECRNYNEAANVLETLFKANRIKPSSREATLFKKIIAEYLDKR